MNKKHRRGGNMQPQRQREQGQQARRRPAAAYLMETADGMLARVPADRLDAFQAARKRPDRPLNKAEQQLSDKIAQEIFG